MSDVTAATRPARRASAGRGHRRELVVLLAAIGVIAGAGIELGVTGTMLVSDVLVAGALAVWWLTAGIARKRRLSAAVLAAAAVCLAGVGAVHGTQDGVLLVRIATTPVLGYLAWSSAMRLSGAALCRTLLATSLVVSGLVLLPALANLGDATVEPSSSLDTAYDALFPRDDSGFVYTSGAVIRTRGPYSHPNEAAGIVAVLTVLSAGIAMHKRLRRPAAMVPVVGAAAVLVTGSRSAVAALVLGGTVLFVYGPGVSARRRPIVATTGTALPLLTMFLVTSGGPQGADRRSYLSRALTVSDAGSDTSVGARLDTLFAAASAAVEHPFGQGLDAFRASVGSAHNSVLFLAAVLGIPLAVLVVTGCAQILARAIDALRLRPAGIDVSLAAPLGAAIMVWMALALTEDRPESTPTLALLSVLVGTVLALRARVQRPERPTMRHCES